MQLHDESDSKMTTMNSHGTADQQPGLFCNMCVATINAPGVLTRPHHSVVRHGYREYRDSDVHLEGFMFIA